MFGPSCKKGRNTASCLSAHLARAQCRVYPAKNRRCWGVRACKHGTFMRQKVMSEWQGEVQTTLMRTSCARGGATSTSSISSGSPAALHTAAARTIPRGVQTSEFRRDSKCPSSRLGTDAAARANNVARTFASDRPGDDPVLLHRQRKSGRRGGGW
jgi:hypothetical protein